MVQYKNTYNIGDQVVPTASNLAATGNVPTIGSAGGTAPVVKAVNVSGRSGQMISTTGGVGDSQSHFYTDSSGALAGRTYDEVLISTATLPTTAPHVFRRNRLDATTTASGYKALVDTAGVIRVQTGSGSGILSLNGGTKPADGVYGVEILYVVNATTPASGSIQARLVNPDTGALIGSASSVTAANLGSGALGISAYVKPDSAAAVSGFTTDNPVWEPGATAFSGPPVTNTPPVASDPAGQNVAAGGAFSVTVTATDDGTIASYAWSVVTGESTATATLTGAATATVSGTAPAAGNLLILQCVITDNLGLSTTVKAAIRTPLAGSATARPLALTGTGVGAWAIVGGSATDGGALADESDTTYLESPALTSTETSRRVRWQPTAARASNVVKLRLWSDSGAPTATVRLYEGTTLRQSWTQALTTTATEYPFTLSSGTLAAVADWSNLYVEVAGVA